MEHQKQDFRIGRILISLGYVTEEQLDQALEIKETKKNVLLGQILVKEGFCTDDQIKKALHEQRKETRLGQILIKQGIVTQEQVDECIQVQQESGALLGFVFVSLGYCTSEQIIIALRSQKRDNRLGALMLREDFITEEQLEHALEVQEEENMLLGEVLIRLKYINHDELAEILILQTKLNNDFPY